MAKSALLIVAVFCLPVFCAPQPPFLRVGTPLPPLLDLRDANPQTLLPKSSHNEAEVEATRLAWVPIVQQFKNEEAVRIWLPNSEGRTELLLAANQALKAENHSIKIYLAFDGSAPPNWDESFWGALEGGAIAPINLPVQPESWMSVLHKAQGQLPARPWTIWFHTDPGAEAANLLGAGAKLVVPPGGPTALLADLIPDGMTEVESRHGRLTVRSRHGQKALHWEYVDFKWLPTTTDKVNATVEVKGKTDYDVHALLSRVRATQLRDRTALISQESKLTINIHAQSSSGMGAELGYFFGSFEKAGEPEEFLQEQVLFNGVRANLKGGLQLPIIESKRSISPPVALSLTEMYSYSDGGPDGEGRRWIRFVPLTNDSTLFSGRILVVEATGRILEERSERSNLPGIVKSERRKLIYGEPELGFWRVMNIQTFERWVLTGGVTQVQRELTYQDFRINKDDFTQRRQEARDSNSTMLRQTEDGVRYLGRNKDGSRYVEERQRTMGRALGGAVLIDPSLEFPVLPGAALAFFDYDAFGKGIQYNAIIAGIFNMGTITFPHLPGGFDATLHASGGILSFTERPVRNGELYDRDGVARQSGQMRLSIGRDLGAGFRMRLQGISIYNRYSDAKEKKYRTPDYVIPPSGFTLGCTGELSWLHRGFQLRGNYGEGKRPDGDFGPPDDIRPIADGGRYKRWGMVAAYDLRLKSTAWIHGEIGMDGGSGFDRFLSLDLGGMGSEVRVSGIRSNAIASDRIQYANLGYILPVGQHFRMSCRVDHARARSVDDQKTHGFTGLGLSGDIPGFWWFTAIRADIGIGLHSDIPGVRSVNGYIALLRVF